MQIYVVGGAVRDILLGNNPKDIDYVVVGATPVDMISQGFTRVGADFPVFLHPVSGEEYALARTERKTGVGYNGFETIFDPSITIVDDLERRDLTINSMAVPIQDWEQFKVTKCPHLIVDPFHGQQDLSQHLLKHTSEAFADDPVRVLRAARFAARYDFDIDSDTLNLMRVVVHELQHVPAERIWTEFEKGLSEQFPANMIRVLHEVNAFVVDIMKPFGADIRTRWAGQTTVELLDRVKDVRDLPIKFALIGSTFTPDDYQRCRIPNDCATLSNTINQFDMDLVMYDCMSAEDRLRIIMKLSAINKPQFVNKLFDVMEIIFPDSDVAQSKFKLFDDLETIRTVDAAIFAASCKSGEEIKQKLFAARVQVMNK